MIAPLDGSTLNFHKIKSRTKIKNLRHCSFYHSIKNKYVNFENCKQYIKKEILVNKIAFFIFFFTVTLNIIIYKLQPTVSWFIL